MFNTENKNLPKYNTIIYQFSHHFINILLILQRLVDSLSQEEPEVRRRLADMTRKITVLRVNEKALARRYNSLTEVQATLRKDSNKMKNEMIAMETAVAERLGYLQRYKDMAQFQVRDCIILEGSHRKIMAQNCTKLCSSAL